MSVLSGEGPQEGSFYDHPYFGQLFLAGFLGATGFQMTLDQSADTDAIRNLFLIPRILMGLLAVMDTFLVYKIAENRFGKRAGFIAAILFAVMPISWLTRRIVLDSILLPFLLASILFAIRARQARAGHEKYYVLLSGAFLGIAIFTKIPAFVMIPLIAYLIYAARPNRARDLGLWFIPVVLIPLLWPAYGAYVGQFDYWLKDVIWQTQRQNSGFADSLVFLVTSDPVITVLAFAGVATAIIRRDLFVILWFVPFMTFLSIIGYVQYFYWIPLLPVFCIAAASLIDKVSRSIVWSPHLLLAGISVVGIVSTTMFIVIDVTSAQFAAAAFVATLADDQTTIAASPSYSWLLIYVYGTQNTFTDYRELLFQQVETRRLVLVSDTHLESNLDAGPQIREAYDNSQVIKTFEGNVSDYDTSTYPYTNLRWNFEGSHIEIRVVE